MEMASISGKMEVYTWVNLWKAKNTEKVNGAKYKTSKIVTTMMANINMIKRTVTESLLGTVEIYTRETIKMMKEMDMERCSGLMALFIKVNGRKVFSMEWVK